MERKRPRTVQLVQPEQQPRQPQGQQTSVGRGKRRETVTRQTVSVEPFQLISDDNLPIGGRLRHFAPFWRRLTNSKKVIQTILGAKIPLISEPIQREVPEPYHLSTDAATLIRKEVRWMVEQKIAVPVEPRPDQVVSPFFLATKKEKSKQPILNVKRINQNHLPKLHFKMETLALVLPLIKKNEWFTSWDVRKGFFNIAIHPEFRRFFCFEFEGVRYKYTCLVMGLAIAPLFFSKLMAILVQTARSWGIQVSYYLDDTLLRAPSPKIASTDTRDFGSLLQMAGFLLHEGKSVQTPTQTIEYLGFVIDSRTMTIALPQEKRQRLARVLQRHIKLLKARQPLTIREAAKVVGLLVAATPATRYGRAHYRTLEQAKLDALQTNRFDFQATFVWPQSCLPDLAWWLAHINRCKTSFTQDEPTTTIVTDASLEGWGAIWNDQQVFGGWEKEEDRIDELELQAVLFALQTFTVLQTHKVISVRCDNTVAVAYINHMGGRIPRLDRIARRIWNLLEQHNAFVVATYIPTDVNPADELTRGRVARAQVRDIEVQLNPEIFHQLKNQGPFLPVIDWFASSINHQLPRFYSWSEVSKSDAEGFDAFSFFWGDEIGYMFPPFNLLPRVISKVQRDGARVLLLIHPLWPGSLWSPSLNEITITRTPLDPSADLLRYPDSPNLRHPMTDLRLAASWIDGRSSIPPSGTRSRRL